MANITKLLTEHIDIWTAVDTEKKSGRGRASGNAGSVYGVKKLRELILELAVCGKLVPQDPNDEPSSELLKRIQAEKAKLIAEGKLKKEKPLAPIEEDEEPFEVPIGWKWVRLSEVAEANTGYAFKSNEYTNEGTFVLRVTNINPDTSINPEDAKFISTESANNEYKNFQLAEGDVLLVMVGGSLGKIGVVDKSCLPAVLNQNMWKLNNFGKIEKKYFIDGLRFINRSQIVITESTHGHLAQGEYLSKLFPLPPLSEQHRIVAKVDELMALCDKLEQQHSTAQEAHETLVSQLLSTLTQSQKDAEFNANWQRIYAHFDVLFTTESSIDTLKQTLLQLAVMGKLVPQDHNDEPASELLNRIQAEKAKLSAEGKLKKEKSLAPIDEYEKPFELPRHWAWVRLSQISKVITGNAFRSEDFNEVNGTKTVKITNAGVHEFIETEDYLPKKFSDKYKEFLIKTGDLVLAQTRPYIADGLKISVCSQSYDNSLLNQRVVSIRAISYIFNLYIYTYMKTPEVLNFYMNKFSNSGLQPNLKITDVTELLIALPPVNEQQRIVAKVDALMALCDQLKMSIQQANQQQQAIADALVMQAVY